MFAPSIFNNHLTNVFDDFFDDSFWNTTVPSARTSMNAMKTDIRELENSYEIDMELPGYTKENVQAELKNGYLTVSAQHTDSTEEKDSQGKYLRRERYYGNYQRSFYVGDNVTEEDIKAKFTDGILSITVPKQENKPKEESKKLISIEG